MSFPGHVNERADDYEVKKSLSRQYYTTIVHQALPKVKPEDNVLDAPKQVDNGILQQKEVPVFQEPSLNLPDGKNKAIKNNTIEQGVKLKNKTLEMGEKVKNKTLEQLAVIGVVGQKKNVLPQLIFIPEKWNLSVSFEDIGEIMKETEFLNKVDPLNLDGPILISSRNRTANFTYNMPLKLGFCDCFERYCWCCGQLANSQLHLNTSACFNFTFVSKTHVSSFF